jgi:hypothetical protein
MRFGKPDDTIVHQEAPLNAEPPCRALAATPVTPLERFYVRNHGPIPETARPLRVEGLVAEGAAARGGAIAYRLDELPLGEVEVNADFLVPDVGARVAAGPVDLRGYAFAGGGRRVARVEVSAGGDGWVEAKLGEVEVNADFLVPDVGARVAAGPVDLRGYAFAGGGRRVARVELSAGGDGWVEAELGEDLGPWAWRLWRARLELGPGRRELLVRAWDDAGATQPEDPATVWNPKGYANNAWGRLTLECR